MLQWVDIGIKRISIFTIVILCCISNIQSQPIKQTKKYTNPFDTLRYDKAIAYDYDGYPNLQIVANGQLLPVKKRIFKEKELTKQQVKRLNKIVGDKKSYGQTTAACFDPHFGVVYYNKNKIVGHVSVCLACNFLKSTPDIPATHAHASDLCNECYAFGFTKPARKSISKFVRELQFSHWELNSSLFDN